MFLSIARNINSQCRRKTFTDAQKLKAHQHQHHPQHNHHSLLLGKFTHNSTNNAYFRQHLYRSYSSSSSSEPQSKFGGFLKWYLGMLQTRPFLTKSVSSSLIFAAADITSQVMYIVYHSLILIEVFISIWCVMPSSHLESSVGGRKRENRQEKTFKQ